MIQVPASPQTAPAGPPVDLLLVTVTDVETRAVLTVVAETLGRRAIAYHIGPKTYYDLGAINGVNVWLVRSEMGTATPGGALVTIAMAIDTLQPPAIIMVGIAFGTAPQHQHIGDILIARQLALYDSRRVGTRPDGTAIVIPRGDRVTCSTTLLDRVRHAILSWSSPPAVQVGLLLSGDTLIDHQGFRDGLLQVEPEAIGGEMEGAGLYVAASARKVDWLLIKAICDWADGRKAHRQHEYQQLAAHNAATFTVHVLHQSDFGLAPSVRPRTHPAPQMAPPLPPDFVPRPRETDALLAQLLAASTTGTVALTTALRGAGGYGKTTLAQAVCADMRIAAQFPDGVLWVSLGERPSTADLIAKAEALITTLTGATPPHMGDLTAVAAQLAAALGERRLLLVIDDVWQRAHLQPFLHGGPRCVRLLTTRDRAILASTTPTVAVDAMAADEASTLLQTGLPNDAPCAGALRALAVRLGEWPVLLKLVNGALHSRVRAGQALAAALGAVNQTLDRRGLVAFDARDAEARDQAVATTIGVSLEQLDAEEQSRFAELAIFPEDVDIPLEVVARLWGATAALDALDVELVCLRLFNLSLLLGCNLSTRTIRLHDVIRAYLTHRHQPHLAAWHAVLLDACRPASGAWHDLPASAHYLWQHLADHLAAAQRYDDLVRTVHDPRFLARKSWIIGTAAAEGDLQHALRAAGDAGALATLQRAYTQASHLLAGCASYDDVALTLLSRLSHLPPLREPARVFAQQLPHPLIVPWHPLPDLPSTPLLRTISHDTTLYTGTISPDGALVVAGDGAGRLMLWDARSGVRRAVLAGHTEGIQHCVLSATGQLLVAAAMDTTLTVWDVARGRLVRTLVGHQGPVRGCAISADGAVVVSSSDDGTLRVWELDSDRPPQVWHAPGELRGCAISADGAVIAAATTDGAVLVWDAAGQPRAFAGHQHAVTACALYANGTRLASASWDNTLIIWDVPGGAALHRLTGHTGWVLGCAVSPDETLLLSASRDHTLRLWDVSAGELRATISAHADWVMGCASSAGGLLASVVRDGQICVWDLPALLRAPQPHPDAARPGCCAVHPAGTLALTGTRTGDAIVWDALTGQVQRILRYHALRINDCAWSPDGTYAVLADEDSTLTLWDARTLTLRHTLTGHRRWVNRCAISPDAQLVASSGSEAEVIIWDARSGQQRQVLRGVGTGLHACVFSPDGLRVGVATSDGAVQVCDLGHNAWHTLVERYASRIYCWATLPQGRSILVTSRDRVIALWDVAAGQEYLRLAGHTDVVQGCALSPDHARLISVGDDQTLRLWCLVRGALLATLRVDGPLYDCAWFPTGDAVMAVGERGVYWLHIVENDVQWPVLQQ